MWHRIKVNVIHRAFGKDIEDSRPDVILVPVRVNNRFLGQMILDTGSTCTVFDNQNIFRWISHPTDSIPTRKNETVITTPDGHKKLIAEATLDSFRVGSTLELKDFDVYFGDIFSVDEILVAGVLGMDFLKHFESFTINLESGILELEVFDNE